MRSRSYISFLLALCSLLLAERSVQGRRRRRARRIRPAVSRAERGLRAFELRSPALPYLSVRVTKRCRIWDRPGGSSLGEVLSGTHLTYLGKTRGPRCKGGEWYNVGRQQYLCAANGNPSFAFPHGTSQPVLRPGSLIPRRIYYALRDGVAIYKSKEDIEAGRRERVVERGFAFEVRHSYIRVKGKAYVLTRRGEYVRRDEMGSHRPSDFEGRRLNGIPKIMLGCIYTGKKLGVYHQPGRGGRKVGTIEKYTFVDLHEHRIVNRKKYYRIGEGRWVRATYVRRFRYSDPPKELKSLDEKWIEVLTGEQTLVAYEGTKPVYATLVATGRHDYPTPPGIHRVRIKIAVDAMNNRPGAAELYKVEAVPWIMYFFQGYALHGAYWHNGFGYPRSHGCINLSPKDAKIIFDWVEPRLSPGWHSRWADRAHPGTILRVRKNPLKRSDPS